LDENAKKRKRELGLDDSDQDGSLDEPGREQPREGLQVRDKSGKRQKLNPASNNSLEKPAQNDADCKAKKAEKRKEKAERKEAKEAKRKAKAEAKKARKNEAKAALNVEAVPGVSNENGADSDVDETGDTAMADGAQFDGVDFSGLEEARHHSASSASPSPAPESPRSEASAKPSAASSTSSIVPSLAKDKDTEEGLGHHANRDELQARLHARIEALRSARKADGPDGRPARNRAELLEARRKKEEQRKAHKKELRKQAREDEIRKKAEVELALLRGSGSPLSTPDVFSPRSPPQLTNLSFGRVAFSDGQQLDAKLAGLIDVKKRKGAQDAKGALQAAQKKQARINGFDAEKKADIQDKDLWLNAKKKVHGERVRDDVSLLKKTLKIKQKAKAKSEKEWDDRISGVQKGQEMRQKKREENLRKRREEKGGKGGKKKGVKTKSRPGFEGSFRSSSKKRK
jgi:hypothetical protein